MDTNAPAILNCQENINSITEALLKHPQCKDIAANKLQLYVKCALDCEANYIDSLQSDYDEEKAFKNITLALNKQFKDCPRFFADCFLEAEEQFLDSIGAIEWD